VTVGAPQEAAHRLSLPFQDARLEILRPRHRSRIDDYATAPAVWTAVLDRSPGYAEAIARLGQYPEITA
jgi:hypothetical protein